MTDFPNLPQFAGGDGSADSGVTELPAQITLTLDLDHVLATAYQDYDGEWVDGQPVALGPDLINRAADRLAQKVYKDVHQQIQMRTLETVVEAIAGEVQLVLSQPFVPLTRYGSPVDSGKQTTLRELIGQELTNYLQGKERNAGTYRRTDGNHRTFADLIKDEVEGAINNELRKEIDAAKAAAREIVRTRAAKMLAEASELFGGEKR
jgi:hypothetical protein